jgi:hypothetical protein
MVSSLQLQLNQPQVNFRQRAWSMGLPLVQSVAKPCAVVARAQKHHPNPLVSDDFNAYEPNERNLYVFDYIEIR